MLKEIHLDEMAGRTVSGFARSTASPQAVIVFTDGTFATLAIDRGYAPGEEEITEGSLDMLEFGNDKLIAVGVATAEELKEEEARQHGEWEFNRKNAEHATYMRLKEKFES